MKLMQVSKSEKDLKAFIDLCTKYQPYDDRYADLSLNEGVFNHSLVESAYLVYLILVASTEDSRTKKAYNIWRAYHHGESRRIYILFNYVDHLLGDDITDLLNTGFDLKNRNMDRSWMLVCRIFILWGIVAQKPSIN